VVLVSGCTTRAENQEDLFNSSGHQEYSLNGKWFFSIDTTLLTSEKWLDNITLVKTSGEDLNEGGNRRSYYRRSSPGPETQLSAGEKTEFRLKGKEKRVIRYYLAMDGKKGNVEFTLDSKTGGSDSKDISIEVK